MNPEDDPEERIRQLERPLANQAQASELGRAQYGSGTNYVPPPAPAYTPPDYNTPAYGSPHPYGTQPYGTQPYGAVPYGTQPYGQFPSPPQKSSGGIPWVVFGLIAVVFIGAIVAGAVVYTTKSGGGSSVSGGAGTIDVPSIPSRACRAFRVCLRSPVHRMCSWHRPVKSPPCQASTETGRSPALTVR